MLAAVECAMRSVPCAFVFMLEIALNEAEDVQIVR